MYACNPTVTEQLVAGSPGLNVVPMYAVRSEHPVATAAAPGLGDAVTDWLTSTTTIFGFDISNWILVGIGGLAVWQLTGTTAKMRARKRAKADYERALADIDQRYSTAGRLRSGARKAKRLIPRVSVG